MLHIPWELWNVCMFITSVMRQAKSCDLIFKNTKFFQKFY